MQPETLHPTKPKFPKRATVESSFVQVVDTEELWSTALAPGYDSPMRCSRDSLQGSEECLQGGVSGAVRDAPVQTALQDVSCAASRRRIGQKRCARSDEEWFEPTYLSAARGLTLAPAPVVDVQADSQEGALGDGGGQPGERDPCDDPGDIQPLALLLQPESEPTEGRQGRRVRRTAAQSKKEAQMRVYRSQPYQRLRSAYGSILNLLEGEGFDVAALPEQCYIPKEDMDRGNEARNTARRWQSSKFGFSKYCSVVK
jgi:hypothetical protein